MKDYEISLMIAQDDPLAGVVVRMWTEMVADGGDPDEDPFRYQHDDWDHLETIGGE